jgi:hypothetical protein
MHLSSHDWLPFARIGGGTTFFSRWRLIHAAATVTVLALLAGGRASAQMVPGPDSDAPDAPAVRITNGLVTAVLHLPDPERGYYRATRFDWSGAVAELRAGGHSYFGRWFPEYDPKRHDAITGPVQEYVTGQGFDAAGPGQTFVKIGVGVLRKPAEPTRDFRHSRSSTAADGRRVSTQTPSSSSTRSTIQRRATVTGTPRSWPCRRAGCR